MRARIPWLRLYYAATVLFALADWLFGANVRAVGFAAWPGLRAVYYGACLGLALLMRWRPAWAAPLALLESGVNLVALHLAVLVPYFALADAVSEHGTPGSPYGPGFLVNFLIAGTIATVAARMRAHAIAPGPLGRIRL